MLQKAFVNIFIALWGVGSLSVLEAYLSVLVY